MEWLCTGMMERLMLCKAFLWPFPGSATRTASCKEKLWLKPCLFPTIPLPCPSLLARCWRNLGSPCFLRSSWTLCITPGWVSLQMPLPRSHCSCRHFLSAAEAVELCLLEASSQSASAPAFGSRQQPCQCMVLLWSFAALFLFLLLYWESGFGSVGNILCTHAEKKYYYSKKYHNSTNSKFNKHILSLITVIKAFMVCDNKEKASHTQNLC